MSEESSNVRGVLQAGTTLRGYVIETVLGSGGYGVVYRASHQELGHRVAIKEYLPADLSIREEGTVYPRSPDCAETYEDGKRRFLEEAKQIIGFKDDPGVVTCTDFFRANGTAYLVMEYVDGLSLSDLLKQREAAGRPFNEDDLKSVAGPLLATLSRLHRAGVLHRDIKPSNILLRRSDGQPVLTDFGAAKQLTAALSKSVAPFTEGYAAIEQVGEGQLGTWTDVYAFGALLWRMVAGGKPPWKPPNPKRVELRASAVLDGKSDPLPSAAELGAGRFSAGLLSAIDEALTVSIATRPKDLGHLERELEGKTQSEDMSEPSANGHSRRWSLGKRRQRVFVGVVAVIAVAIIAWLSNMSPGKVWTNRLGMEFVLIPAGEFEIKDIDSADGPMTALKIKEPFWIGRYEVTQTQWEAVMESPAPSHFVNCGGECPVENVSWDSVHLFLENLNSSGDGQHYRLPTEAEWEYVLRAGSVVDTNAVDIEDDTQDSEPELDQIAWYADNSYVEYAGGLICRSDPPDFSTRCGIQPVGGKTPNAFGLYDVFGNVSELVEDHYNGNVGKRVVLGCSWLDSAYFCRSSRRAAVSREFDSKWVGFRLVRTDRAK